MGKLNLEKLVADFRSALGWPYVSPGTNNQEGIDCSGMFVRAYKLQGASIYHGSNTIYRQYLTSDKGRVTTPSQLQIGMAVFKRKEWTEKDTKNKFYGDEIGNMSHIGLVVSVNPVRIIHASTNGMRVREDAWSSAWNYYGRLKDVNYESSGEEVRPLNMYVLSPNGGGVNLRSAPNRTTGKIVTVVASGSEVAVIKYDDSWSEIEYNGKHGYMSSEFLSETKPTPSVTPTTGTNKERLKTLWVEMGKIIDAM